MLCCDDAPLLPGIGETWQLLQLPLFCIPAPAGLRRGAGAAPPALLQLHRRRQWRDLQRAHQHCHGGEDRLRHEAKQRAADLLLLLGQDQQQRLVGRCHEPATSVCVRSNAAPEASRWQHCLLSQAAPGHCAARRKQAACCYSAAIASLPAPNPACPCRALPSPPNRWPCPTVA